MNVNSFLRTAGALVLALAVAPAVAPAQAPLYDTVLVNLPYTVTIGEQVLQPGPYVIRQMESPGGASRVLNIYSSDGMKFETAAITIPVLDNRTPDDTSVILHHFGPDYYFDKIWIQGKNYGYEFPLPDSVKARERERMAPLTVAATYQAAPEQQAAVTEEETTTAEAAPPPAEAAPEPAPEVAEAQPAPAPAPEASREMPETLPATSAGWLMSLLGGGLLAAAGFSLRRR